VALTVNEQWLDALVRHQVYLQRVSGSIRNRVVGLLDKTEADIRDKIVSRLLRAKQGLHGENAQRLLVLERVLNRIRTEAWTKVTDVWREEVEKVAEAEVSFLAGALTTVSPVVLDLALPSPSLLRALATSRPFQGKTLRQWSKDVAASDLKRMREQIAIGMAQGEGSADIARRVVGSVSKRGVDGSFDLTRKHAESITRTAVNFISNAARQEFTKANASLFSGELFIATLDARTTAVCRGNDGEQFPVGTGPIPPLHMRCRSLRVPLPDGKVLGERPMRNFTERQLVREYADANGLGELSLRKALPHGHKTSFDAFRRKRIRELTGQAPATTTYQAWLKGQSRQFQIDVLGKTKARLFREGGLTLDKFTNRAGDELTISQLASRHADAFRAAGLESAAFA
jgi:SPP1 gp7 family putative phage head morphogenesis protein